MDKLKYFYYIERNSVFLRNYILNKEYLNISESQKELLYSLPNFISFCDILNFKDNFSVFSYPYKFKDNKKHVEDNVMFVTMYRFYFIMIIKYNVQNFNEIFHFLDVEINYWENILNEGYEFDYYKYDIEKERFFTLNLENIVENSIISDIRTSIGVKNFNFDKNDDLAVLILNDFLNFIYFYMEFNCSNSTEYLTILNKDLKLYLNFSYDFEEFFKDIYSKDYLFLKSLLSLNLIPKDFANSNLNNSYKIKYYIEINNFISEVSELNNLQNTEAVWWFYFKIVINRLFTLIEIFKMKESVKKIDYYTSFISLRNLYSVHKIKEKELKNMKFSGEFNIPLTHLKNKKIAISEVVYFINAVIDLIKNLHIESLQKQINLIKSVFPKTHFDESLKRELRIECFIPKITNTKEYSEVGIIEELNILKEYAKNKLSIYLESNNNFYIIFDWFKIIVVKLLYMDKNLCFIKHKKIENLDYSIVRNLQHFYTWNENEKQKSELLYLINKYNLNILVLYSIGIYKTYLTERNLPKDFSNIFDELINMIENLEVSDLN